MNKIADYIKNILFPIRCNCCGEFVESIGICAQCWKKISWITDPKCRICGAPFEIEISDICAGCLSQKPFFDQAVSVFEYDDFSKGMILKFKHQDATHMKRQFVTWMYRTAEKLLKSVCLLIPVPIHFRKLLSRKYNQSELLARGLRDISGVSYEPRILIKSKPTLQQEGLTRERRKKNVIGSFDVNEKYAHLLLNKSVLLVDDVFTTGSTANECSRILKKHGATSVAVLTLAKVVLGKS